jgi:hypothetical protein
MNELQETNTSRGKILIRLAITFVCLALLGCVQFLIQVISLVQYAILLITLSHSEPLRSFSNKAAAYAYRLIRYVTLNENRRPFPFSDLPPEMESPEYTVKFD